MATNPVDNEEGGDVDEPCLPEAFPDEVAFGRKPVENILKNTKEELPSRYIDILAVNYAMGYQQAVLYSELKDHGVPTRDFPNHAVRDSEDNLFARWSPMVRRHLRRTFLWRDSRRADFFVWGFIRGIKFDE